MQVTAIKVRSCKEIGGATSVMSAIKGMFSQQAADTTDQTVCRDWPQVASVVTCRLQV